MKLIENARYWYKMFSVQMLLLIAMLQGIVVALPPTMLDAQAPFTGGMTYRDVNVFLTIAVAVIGGIGRLVQQSSLTPPSGEADAQQSQKQPDIPL